MVVRSATSFLVQYKYSHLYFCVATAFSAVKAPGYTAGSAAVADDEEEEGTNYSHDLAHNTAVVESRANDSPVAAL